MKNIASTTVRVRYSETDQMGVVHHANYIKWFEVGRTEWLRQLGSDYRSIEERGLLLPVIKVDCRYKSPARYDDVVEIQARCKEYTGVKLTFAYELYVGSKLLVTGETAHCWTGVDFKPVALKRKWPDLHHWLHDAMLIENDFKG